MSTPLTPVTRAVHDGYYSAYRRGGYHAEQWIVVLACGHAQHVSVDPGKKPDRPRKCRVCGDTSMYWTGRSDELLARLARMDAEAAEAAEKKNATEKPACVAPHADDAQGARPVNEPRAPLPRIVRFLGTSDCPDSECPHCGARGRFIHRFLLETGGTGAAMSGCVQLFPVSPVAREEARLKKKLADYMKRGWNGLNRRDTEALEAIEAFYAGTIDERSAMVIVKGAKAANRARYRR